MSRTKAAPKHPTSLWGPWGLVALALAAAMSCAVALGTDRAGLPRAIAVAAGALVGVLTVVALPSVPTRSAVVAVLGLGGLVVARHAAAPGADIRLVLGWALGTVLAFALAHRAQLGTHPALGSDPSVLRGSLRVAFGATAAVAVVAMLLAPTVGAAVRHDFRAGEPANPFADPQSSANLSYSDRVDMRSRPRLSDRVVMTVQADRPAFWRGQVFDSWSGTTWTRGDARHPSLLLPGRIEQRVDPPADDPAATNGRVNRQTFTMEAAYAQIVYAAPTAVSIETDRPVAQFDDATMLVADETAFGRGASYTVTSREPNATEATLRASATSVVPEAIVQRYAQASPATDRVRALAQRITAGAATPYDKVRAIEAYLGAHTTYSLDAPLPPSDTTDVVDWYVFDARQGWCEQIASTLVVMAREVGIPARLVTGFVTGDQDLVTGRYTVRERDSHAWAEIYFPGVGWQGFDPTAAVPLAGESAQTAGVTDWVGDHLLVVVSAAVLAALLWWAAPVLLRRWQLRRERRRAVPAWAARALADLEAVGAAHERRRAPNETPRQYARAVARVSGRPDLARVGDTIDAAGFGADPPSADRLADADALLAAARGRDS